MDEVPTEGELEAGGVDLKMRMGVGEYEEELDIRRRFIRWFWSLLLWCI